MKKVFEGKEYEDVQYFKSREEAEAYLKTYLKTNPGLTGFIEEDEWFESAKWKWVMWIA